MDLSTPTWAVIEIMGHRLRAGLIQEVEVFGTKQLRIDIPVDDASVTEFYGGAAIFSIRLATEEVARATAQQVGDVRPVMPFSYRRLPPPDTEGGGASGFEHDEDEVEF